MKHEITGTRLYRLAVQAGHSKIVGISRTDASRQGYLRSFGRARGFILSFMVVLPVLFLAACAAPGSLAGGWENPKLPPERWAVDTEICRRAATRDVEEKYTRRTVYLGREEEDRYTFQGRMNRYEAIKEQGVLTARCLRAKGYRRILQK